MNPETWRRAQEIMESALSLHGMDRAAYLDAACAGDGGLRSEVESLLGWEGRAGEFLQKPFFEVARAMGASENPETPPIAEEIFGGLYRLGCKLGEGGMGVVYHAQQLQPIRRDVALKLIKPGMDSQQVIARFESERQALAMMDHPNIARVFDAGATTTGLPYFVMELVEGSSITVYCDAKRLNISARLKLLLPVCHAIQHAHHKGIIHRDIKPSNILVKDQEGHGAPKVIDFGLAKALGQQIAGATMMTTFGMVMGTLEYMSPEQAEVGLQDIDTRSDVYSLGAVLYELLTGSPPMERREGESYLDLLRRIREEEVPRPSARLPRLEAELDWIVMKALEKDRSRRYETVNGLARDLERFLGGEPVEAAPPSAMYRIRKFAHKHRVWLATAASFTALLVAAVVVSTWMAVRAGRAEQAAILERNTANAVNDFLQHDLLAQASANQQARPDVKPDPDLKVRTALDRAAARVSGKFSAQPLIEASIRHTMGATYYDLGLLAEAQQQFERALEMRRRALGEEQADTLSTMNDLAVVYQYQGKYAQAEPLLAKVVEVQRRVPGERDRGTLSSMNILAYVYNLEGKREQALPLAQRVFELRRAVLGEEDPDTISSMNDLGLLYQSQGKLAEAEPLFVRALELRRRINGEEHPDTLIAAGNLGRLFRAEGKYAQAEPLLIKTYETERRVIGEEHPNTLATIFNLGGLYLAEGKYDQAEQIYRKVFETARRVLGEQHPNTLSTMNYLGIVYGKQQRYAQAETTLLKVFEGRRRVLGESHPDSIDTAKELASLYQDWGRREKASEWRRKAAAKKGTGD